MFANSKEERIEEDKKMFYCKKCVMPNTRPGITFNSEGVCSACQAYSIIDIFNIQQIFKHGMSEVDECIRVMNCLIN